MFRFGNHLGLEGELHFVLRGMDFQLSRAGSDLRADACGLL